MKSSNYCCVTILILTLNFSNAIAQDIDSFLLTLYNKDAISSVVLLAPEKWSDSRHKIIYVSSLERILTSVDVNELRKKYPKYLIVEKLIGLLDDSERDWYANLLLYGLTKTSSSSIIKLNSRDDWLKAKPNSKKTYKEEDVEMWRRYLSKLSPSATF